MFDLLIKHGTVYDGLDHEPKVTDIAVRNGRIAKIGGVEESQARKVFFAEGLFVIPAMIDAHTHADYLLLEDPVNLSKLHQGVCCEISGNCGFSLAPYSEEYLPIWQANTKNITGELGNVPWDFPDFAKYMERIGVQPLGQHYGAMVGTGAIRAAIKGMQEGPLTQSERERARALVEEAVAAGAMGLSSGLIYAPDCYSTTEDLLSMVSGLKKSGLPYVTHMRGEGVHLVESVKEALHLARAAEVPLQISHFKAMGPESWPLLEEAIGLIEKARAAGQDVTCDAYPYTGGATTMTALLPPWVMEGGSEKATARLKDKALRRTIEEELMLPGKGWDNVLPGIGWSNVLISRAAGEPWRAYSGKTIAQIAQMRGEAPMDVFINCLADSHCHVACIHFSMQDADVMRILQLPFVYLASDSIYVPKGAVHPRAYGTFAKALKWAVQDKKLPLGEVVKKATSMPAKRFGLTGRGVLAEGNWADITVFSGEICDRASYTDPEAQPAGIAAVYIEGEQVMDRGRYCAARPMGRLLRPSL